MLRGRPSRALRRPQVQTLTGSVLMRVRKIIFQGRVLEMRVHSIFLIIRLEEESINGAVEVLRNGSLWNLKSPFLFPILLLLQVTILFLITGPHLTETAMDPMMEKALSQSSSKVMMSRYGKLMRKFIYLIFLDHQILTHSSNMM